MEDIDAEKDRTKWLTILLTLLNALCSSSTIHLPYDPLLNKCQTIIRCPLRPDRSGSKDLLMFTTSTPSGSSILRSLCSGGSFRWSGILVHYANETQTTQLNCPWISPVGFDTNHNFRHNRSNGKLRQRFSSKLEPLNFGLLDSNFVFERKHTSDLGNLLDSTDDVFFVRTYLHLIDEVYREDRKREQYIHLFILLPARSRIHVYDVDRRSMTRWVETSATTTTTTTMIGNRVLRNKCCGWLYTCARSWLLG